MPDNVLMQMEQIAQKTNATIISVIKNAEDVQSDAYEEDEKSNKYERISYEVELTTPKLKDFHSFLDDLLAAD